VAELVGVVLGVLVTNGLASLLVAYVAGQKGRSKVGFFWLSFFTSFLIGILVVIAIPQLEESQASQKRSYTGRVSYTASGLTVKCPLCAEWVSGEAKVCKHCGRDIADEVRGAIESERQAEESERRAAIAEDGARRAEAMRFEEENTRRERELFEEKSRKRRELFGSKRFRVAALVGAGVALLAVTSGILFVLTIAADDAAREAETADRLDRLPETYLRAVDDCASSAGVGDVELKTRYRIAGTTLTLRYETEFGVVSDLEDDFIDCVVSALTGTGASNFFALTEERDIFTLSRSGANAILTIALTP
jgi:hypothetical protein